MARSNTPGRRRSGAAGRPRAAGTTAAPVGALSLDDATRPRVWEEFTLQPLADAMTARPLFDFAAMPWLTKDVPFDPWSAEELEKHKREILLVARTMLGIRPQRGRRGSRG